MFCSAGQDSVAVYHSLCDSHAADSVACGESVRVLSRSADMLQVTAPPHGFPRYIAASAVSQQAGKLVPFDDDSGVPDKGAPDCAHQPERNVTPPRAIYTPEPGYTPSAKLADFVRCRDLTCRAPGCDRPAFQCDVDHTIPYAKGGATHPSNLKCLCRLQDGPMIFCRVGRRVRR